MKILLIDSYDSFTHILADYIRQCSVECDILRNDDPALLNIELVNAYDALVLSPGPLSPEFAGHLMAVIRDHHKSRPMLGVCLGHQALGEFFGATLQKAILPRHGKVDNIMHNGNPLFQNIPQQMNATRYHSLVLTETPEVLEVTAVSDKQEVMAIAHRELPLWGIQFHPESCLTEKGIIIIQNFLLLARSKY